MTDFRALCSEIVEKIDYTWGDIPEDVLDLMQRARIAVAQAEPEFTPEEVEMIQAPWSYLTPPQPEPQGPTDEELLYAWEDCRNAEPDPSFPKPIAFARAVLARWGRPAIKPVPVAERPWEREGWCDAEGRCYGWDGAYWWMIGNPGSANETITHWLPHYALPVPQQEAE